MSTIVADISQLPPTSEGPKAEQKFHPGDLQTLKEIISDDKESPWHVCVKSPENVVSAYLVFSFIDTKLRMAKDNFTFLNILFFNKNYF